MTKASRIAAGWFAAGLGCATVCPAARVEVRLEPPPSSGTPSARAEAVVRAVATDAASPRQARLEVESAATIPGRTTLDLEPGRVWRIELQSDKYWSAERLVVPGETGEAVTLPVLPTGALRGSVEPPVHEQAPPRLEIRFQSSPGAASGPRVSRSVLSCPIEGGRWRCSPPAGTLDVRLAAPGFIPVYRWDQVVPAGQAVDLGTLKLVRGSSVAGRVEAASGAPVHKLCQVLLTPNSAGRPPESEQRGALLAPASGVDERGFFHFDGVKPGSYKLTARQPGLAPASIPVLIVGADQETEIEQPLVLTPLLKLAVNVDPPLDPWEKPWGARLRLMPQGAGTVQEAAHGAFSAAGSYRAEGLERGAYILEINDSQGTNFLSEHLDLDSDRTLDRTLDVVWLEGTVRLGDAPLETGLRFTSKARLGARVQMRSDAKGRFQGVLPHEGRWRVELTAIHRTLPAVQIKRLPATRSAKVAIEVLDTKLSGETVDEKGQPLSASITVLSVGEGDFATAASDTLGAFELGGLFYSTYSVQAETEREGTALSSDPVLVGLSKNHPTEFVRLILHAQVAISGQVRSGSQAVAGARVTASPKGLPGLPPLLVGSEAITGAEGGFRLTVPAPTSEVLLVVSPPGFAMRSLRLSAPFPSPVAVEVVPGGTLILAEAMPIDSSLLLDAGSDTRLPLVLQDGNPIPFSQMLGWASTNGQPHRDVLSRVVVPNVAAGEYTACMLTFAQQFQVFLGLAAVDSTACQHGYLSAGGELTLRLGEGR